MGEWKKMNLVALIESVLITFLLLLLFGVLIGLRMTKMMNELEILKGEHVNMDRLTIKDDLGNWQLYGVRWADLMAGSVITREIWEKLYYALYRLKDYEDTGLSPEEVEQLLLKG